MKRTTQIDPFFERQPPLSFLELLKEPLHKEALAYFGLRATGDDEVCANYAYVDSKFPDAHNRLEPAYEDFDRFLRSCKMRGDHFPIRIVDEPTPCFESYRITCDENGCTLAAADTEGIRRGLIFLEDEMKRRAGPFLFKGSVERSPHIRSRITRCFFSPINRPPKNKDELADDIDYYPNEYLNRLAHDGTNGIWIYSRFSDLVGCARHAQPLESRQAKIDKLNRIISRCARYGINVYIFLIEPVAWMQEQEINIDAKGASLGNRRYAFCTTAGEGRLYVKKAVEELFCAAPDLKGLISIPYGERATACACAYPHIVCSHCGDQSAGQILAKTTDALREGLRSVNPQAEYIAWTYGHRLWDLCDVEDYVAHAPRDIPIMQNFEDMVTEEQLGRTRIGTDYWLSAVGPSTLFEHTAKAAEKYGKTLYAKMQVCNSHELATLPYIPVPGILFDKYKAAHAAGVKGVMQCWYFGNYPSLMSKAAGELCFTHDFSDKAGFLEHMAGIAWSKTHAKTVTHAWQSFEKGYKNTPLNVMFSYYGPMHDGPVWELALEPKNFPLPRSWQTIDPTNGDRIHEALFYGHTLGEATQLISRMLRHYRYAQKQLNKVDIPPAYDLMEQKWIAHALVLLAESAHNILSFYHDREKLGYGDRKPDERLESMRCIVLREISISRQLARLCQEDLRLGYHSEGEGFKFFGEKLEWRANTLETLLGTEFVNVEKRIQQGLPPLVYYTDEQQDEPVLEVIKEDPNPPKWQNMKDKARFFIKSDGETVWIDFQSDHAMGFTVAFEFTLMKPSALITVSEKGRVSLDSEAYYYHSLFGTNANAQLAKTRVHLLNQKKTGTHLRLCLDMQQCGIKINVPFKMRLATQSGVLWREDPVPVRTLGKSRFSPDDFGRIVIKNCHSVS